MDIHPGYSGINTLDLETRERADNTVTKDATMQKLLTIYLNHSPYQGRKLQENHGAVEEHLTSWFERGWKIVSVTGTGGGAGPGAWVVVVIEKD